MALELQIGTGKAASNLAAIETAVDRLQSKLQGFSAGGFTSAAASISGMKPPSPAVATGIANVGTSSSQAATGMKAATAASVGLGKSFSGLQSLAAGLGLSLGGLGVAKFIKNSYEMVNVTTKLKGVFDALAPGLNGGAEALKFVKMTADRTALSIKATAQAYSTFGASALSSGYSVAKTQKVFGNLATVMRAMNLSTEQTKRTLKGFEQIITKGTFSMEELRNQIGENLPAFKILADTLGMTTLQLAKMMSQGKIGIENLLPFVDRLEKKLGKGLAAAMRTPEAAMQLLNNGWDNLAEAFGKEFFSPMIDPAIALGKQLTALAEQTNGPVQRFGKLAGIIGASLIKALSYLADNLDTLIPLMAGVATYMTAMIAVRIVTFFTSVGASTISVVGAFASLATASTAAAAPIARVGANAGILGNALLALRAGLSAVLFGFTGIAVAAAAAATAYSLYMVATGQTETLAKQAGEAIIWLGGQFGYSRQEVVASGQAIYKWGAGVTDTVTGTMSDAGSAINSFVNGALKYIQQGLQWVVDGIEGGFRNAWNSAGNMLSSFASSVQSTMASIISYVRDAIRAFMDLFSAKSQAEGGSGGGGGGGSGSMFDGFAEGGITGRGGFGGKATRMPSGGGWKGAPHFAQGGTTQGMSGANGIPAILHPNEAVIPLKGGSVPVTISSGTVAAKSSGMEADTGGTNMNSVSAVLSRIQDRLENGINLIDANLSRSGEKLTKIVDNTTICADSLKFIAKQDWAALLRPATSYSSTSSGTGSTLTSSAANGGAFSNGAQQTNKQNVFQGGVPRKGRTVLGGSTGNQYMGVTINPNYDKELAEYLKNNNLTMEEYQAWQAGRVYRAPFAMGTPNTSGEGLSRTRGGGMPVMVHDNEAIIPLPDGRSVPVILQQKAIPKVDARSGSNGGNNVINLTMNIQTQDAKSFDRTKEQRFQDMTVQLQKAAKNIGLPQSSDLSSLDHRGK